MCWRLRCSRSSRGMNECVKVVLEEWNEVFTKCWQSVRRCSISVGGVERRVPEVLDE